VTTAVDALIAALARQQNELSGLLSGLADAEWHAPTRCPGWDVADVVLHLPEEPAVTTIWGSAAELCAVAAPRLDASATSLRGEGPDCEDVLGLVRTYA
jgi:hypothetical protein